MHQGTVPAAGGNARRQHARDAELFRLLVERVVDYAIFLLTPDGLVASWNAGAERVEGYAADEIIGESLERFYTLEDRLAGRPGQLLEAARQSGRVEDEGWRVRKDGSRFWAHVVVTALYGEKGELRAFAKITRDLSERRAASSELRESEQLFATMVDSIRDYAIFMLSPKGTVLTWNQGAERLKGYARDEIIGQSFEQFYTEAARQAGRPAELLRIAREAGRVEDLGWRVRKDGTRFWADVVITALTDERGQLIGFAKVTRDLSDWRSAEEQLRRSEQRFRTLVDSVKDYAIFMLSPEGIVLSWNQGAQRLKGYTPSEIIGQSFERFYTEADRAAGRPERLLSIARTEGRVEDEGWRVRKDGTHFWADVIITALTDDGGQLVGYAKVTRDLTERRQAEQDRAARMAAERAAERLERLQVATAALAAASRPESAGEVLADVATRALDADAGVTVTPSADGTTLEPIAVRGAPYFSEPLPIDGPHPFSIAWHSRRPLFHQSRAQVPANYADLLPSLESTAHKGWAAIPLIIEQRLIGVLGITFDRARQLDPDERGFLLALAEVGAQAMDRARLYVAEQAARERAEAAVQAARDEARLVETLHAVSLALSAELDLDPLLQAATDAATSISGAAFGAFFYNVDDDGDERYEPYTLSGISRESFKDFPSPRNTPLFAATFRGKSVVRSDDIQQDPRYGKHPPYYGMPPGHVPVRSYLAVPVVSASGEVRGGLFFGHPRPGVFTERSERLAVGIAAQAAVAIDNARLYQQVQQAVRTRDEFLAAAAHDLKTPLAATKGIAQLLRNRIAGMQIPDRERITGGLERIDQSVERMTALIDELLDLGRMQLGQPLDLDRQPVDIYSLMSQVVADLQPNAPRHTFRIVSGDQPIVGNWDPIRLRRVLDNLVSNAVKYSPAGGDVVLRAECSTSANGSMVMIQVTDQGVGIPAADLPFVFERFRRGGNVDFIHGTGIGLGIAQSIVQQHGGSISVESIEGKGSTFTVQLPLD